MEANGSYLSHAVKAWQTAAETFTDVFESLARAAAQHETHGNENTKAHAAFEEMAKTARAALNAARAYTSREDSHTTGHRATVSSEGDSENKRDASQEKPSNISRGMRARMEEDRKHRRERKMQKRAIRQANAAVEQGKQYFHYPSFSNGHTHANAELQSQTIKTDSAVPTVEYEDVSAEVEARIRAKDEHKAAAMKDKKRKRESTDSMELMAVDGNASRPDLKRPRVGDLEEEVSNDTETRKHARNDDENIDGQSRKRIRNF